MWTVKVYPSHVWKTQDMIWAQCSHNIFIEKRKEKETEEGGAVTIWTLWNSARLCRALEHEGLSVCPISLCRELASASMTFLEYQRVGSNCHWSGKEGYAEVSEEQSRSHNAALEQYSGASSRDTYKNIFVLFCRIKPPANGRC